MDRAKQESPEGPRRNRVTLSARLPTAGVLAIGVALLAPVSFGQWDRVFVPEGMQEWSRWVAEGLPESYWCPWLDGSGGQKLPCVWPLKLELSIRSLEQGVEADFVLDVEAIGAGRATLPWTGWQIPIDVRVNDRPAVVGFGTNAKESSSKRFPYIVVDEGTSRVTGKLFWVRFPQSVNLPDGLARLVLFVDGARVSRPLVERGTVRLGESVTGGETESDSLSVKVFRLFTDSVPQVLSTQLELTVGGSSRQVSLGRAVPDGFLIHNIDSDLPARVSEDGDLQVMARSGEWEITLVSHAPNHIDAITVERPSPHWRSSEIWAVRARERIRSIRVDGVPQTDLSQLDAPSWFDDTPGYIVDEGDTLTIVELARGDTSPAIENVDVSRRVWLAFDGGSWVTHDELEADVNRESRISASYPLGRVKINDEPRLITSLKGKDGFDGVLLDATDLSVEAVSRISEAPGWFSRSINAVGWNLDANSLSMSMQFPPQWLPIWIGGADQATGTWVEEWTLWDVFVVGLLGVVALRVMGWRWAFPAVAAAVLIFAYTAWPVIGWLALLAVIALARAFTSERVRRWIGRAYWVLAVPVFASSALAAALFVLDAMYPQLDVERGFAQLEHASETPQPPVASERPPAERDAHTSITPFGDFASYREGDLSSLREEILTVTGSRMAEFKVATEAAEVQEVAILEDAGSEEPVWVQTGPGIPEWPDRGTEVVDLKWSGPVGAEQELSMLLLPPWATRLATFFAAALVLYTAWMLLQFRPKLDVRSKGRSGGSSAAAVAALALFVVPELMADVPTYEILDEMEIRFEQPPSCLPECATAESLRFLVEDEHLVVRMQVHVQPQPEETTIDLFGVRLPWMTPWVLPASVESNGRELPLWAEENRDSLLTLLTPGIHSIELRYGLKGLSRVEMRSGLSPAKVETEEMGDWRFEVDPSTALNWDSFTLRRVSRMTPGNEKQALEDVEASLSPLAEVERVFKFEREPRIHTKIRRVEATQDIPIEIRLQLVEGEVVVDEDVEMVDGVARFTLAPDQYRASWWSRLFPEDTVTLQRSEAENWTERWAVEQSDHWSVEFEGIAPVKTERKAGTSFRPRAGETLGLRLKKPMPIEGRSITIENARLTTSASGRYRSTELEFDVVASLGVPLTVRLPETAEIKVLAHGAQSLPVPETPEFSITLPTGESNYTVAWIDEAPMSFWYRERAVELSEPLANVRNQVEFPPNRWVIWLGGPGMGPGILSWALLLVVLAVAAALTRIPDFPLRPVDAVLLSFGVTLANLQVAALVAVWFVAIWVRNKRPPPVENHATYFVAQVLFAGLSVLAVLAIVVTVPMALLGQPQMEVFGVDSSPHSFAWFNDATNGSFPTPLVVSLPLWMYHVLMIGWGFWLAFALVRWVRVAWSAMSKPALWPRKHGSDLVTES